MTPEFSGEYFLELWAQLLVVASEIHRTSFVCSDGDFFADSRDSWDLSSA